VAKGGFRLRESQITRVIRSLAMASDDNLFPALNSIEQTPQRILGFECSGFHSQLSEKRITLGRRVCDLHHIPGF